MAMNSASGTGKLSRFAASAPATAATLAPSATGTDQESAEGEELLKSRLHSLVADRIDPAIETLSRLVAAAPEEAEITASIHAMVKEVQRYVPGYRIKNGPVFDGRRVSVFLEVEGLGDYLPRYAGNLDIMTAAALRTGEIFAERIFRARGGEG